MTAQVSTTSVTEWEAVLVHRDINELPGVIARFEAAGVSAELVGSALADSGVELSNAARSGRADWMSSYGGPLALALIAGEVAAQSAFFVSRASAIRAAAVDALLDDVSAVDAAKSLGVSRQKVYEIGRNGARARDAMR